VLGCVTFFSNSLPFRLSTSAALELANRTISGPPCALGAQKWQWPRGGARAGTMIDLLVSFNDTSSIPNLHRPKIKHCGTR
jgi:hypothetical protein